MHDEPVRLYRPEATGNSIRSIITFEVENHAIIVVGCAGNGRAPVMLAGVGGEIATTALRRESRSPSSTERSAPAGAPPPEAFQFRSAGIRLALSVLPG